MNTILVEGNRIGDFNRHSPDSDVDPRGSKHFHEFPVELSYRPGRQRERFYYSVTGFEYKLMPQEVKPEFECSLSIRDSGGRQAPGSYVQRDIPPVVQERR
jgi:hypothetical protein